MGRQQGRTPPLCRTDDCAIVGFLSRMTTTGTANATVISYCTRIPPPRVRLALARLCAAGRIRESDNGRLYSGPDRGWPPAWCSCLC